MQSKHEPATALKSDANISSFVFFTTISFYDVSP